MEEYMKDKELIERFRSIRFKANLSQKEFAESIGMSQSLIAGIERGVQDPSRNILVAIAQKYKISLDWLLLGIEPTKNAEELKKLISENETLKKENSELSKDIQKIEEECKKLDMENRQISKELVERFRQLVEIQNRQLGIT
jgi:transcriptional regulator with XRE-family HTH domain